MLGMTIGVLDFDPNLIIVHQFYVYSSFSSGADQLPPKFPHIGYLGGGYNIFRGNPHSTQGLDPGFTGLSLYEFSYDQNKTTPDGRYIVPDHTNVLEAETCSFIFSSHNAQNIATYSESLKVDVQADFTGWGASFSASVDYNTVKNSTASSESRYVSSQAHCEAYLAALEPGAKLSDGFKIAVKDLSISDTNEYLDFLKEYGTHFLSSVTMGGRYGFQSEFETSKYMSMLSSGLDVSVSAGYSGYVDVNAKAATEMQKKMASEFNSQRESYSIYQVGGKPPTNPNGTAMAWAQTVKNDPLPVHYRLLEIADLFTKENFEDDPDIRIKQTNLKKATVQYCKDILRLSFCNSYGPESQARIRIVTSNDTKMVADADGVYYQTVNNPDYAVMGMFIGPRDGSSTTDFYALVDSRQSDPKLIATANNWTEIFSDPFGIVHVLRPNCEEGFSSVSDFECVATGEPPDCLSFLPKILPCIANDCLTQCSASVWPSDTPPYYFITNGFKVFGNGNSELDLQVFRYSYSTPDESLLMCLSSECVAEF